MVKMVLSDYWSNKKEYFRRAVQQNNNWYMMLFYPLLIPLQLLAAFDDGEINFWVVYGEMLPILAGWILITMYPNRLSKTLYLCPMEQKERQHYVWTAYWLRIGIAYGMYVVENLIFLCAGKMPAASFWLGAVRVFACLITINIYLNTGGVSARGRRDSGQGQGAIWLAAFLLGIIGALLKGMMISGENGTGILEWSFCIGMTLVQCILAAVMVHRNGKRVMENAMDYELAGLMREADTEPAGKR